MRALIVGLWEGPLVRNHAGSWGHSGTKQVYRGCMRTVWEFQTVESSTVNPNILGSLL